MGHQWSAEAYLGLHVVTGSNPNPDAVTGWLVDLGSKITLVSQSPGASDNSSLCSVQFGLNSFQEKINFFAF